MTLTTTVEKAKIFCNYCNASGFVTDEILGETVCSSCGFVISENAEYRGTDRRFISSTSDNTRTGPGLTLKMHDKGLNTIIGAQNRDSVGKPLPVKTVQIFGRLRKWDSRSQTKNSADKNLRVALVEFDKVQSKLGLSDTIIERASLFYRKAIKRNLIRGRTVKSVAAACLYAACKDLEHDRSLTEIAIQFVIKRKEISRAYRILFKELGFTVNVVNPIKLISKITSKLELSEKTIRKATQILTVAQDAGITVGKNPEILAASVIYAACVITGELKSQTQVAEAANTSTVSIRNRIREFKTKLGLFSTIN
ncbi:transcription factor TFIIB cyclin-related protein [Candidatus Nitrosopumilus koreensis AR1]|uniref:Transcription initiation factor IIB n=1 Tax=Candidatus Nitrosopumilus koreensis AR1 TaxID=1229908 RepID=K0B7B3_9ARCH|nr:MULTISPECIES: transcription factor TFIIB cyclin-related protein [Nitrosopumilus]AFS81369.1 transcription factor TFIIB cyclin-related protein [Candidatus Nitrosopumilus koreensis AR1]